MPRISITTEQIEYLAHIGIPSFKSETDINNESPFLLRKLRHVRRNSNQPNLIILIGTAIFIIITWLLKHPLALK